MSPDSKLMKLSLWIKGEIRMSLFRSFKNERPEPGTRILAFSPVYKRGDPMRLRMVTVLPVGMDEVSVYALEPDIELAVLADALFK